LILNPTEAREMTCILWKNVPDLDNEEFIKRMFQDEKIVFKDQKGVWSIKNKYYSCDVNIQVHQQSNNASSQENLKIGASLWYSDQLKSDKVIEKLDQWQKDLKTYLKIKDLSEEHSSSKEVEEEEGINVEVQLIVVEKFDSEETKSAVTEWSINRGIELIDFSEDDDEQDEDAENVTVFASNGRKRIIEALQTVMWPEICDTTKTDENNDMPPSEKDVENFESLFAKLVNFKETAAGLPDEERKKFAEQVAMSFYNALGENSDDDSS